jgi:GH18 family chitinase
MILLLPRTFLIVSRKAHCSYMTGANIVTVASTVPNRQTFINSLISYLQKYGLDGVDIDWEYPAAIDRGGSPEDIDNFVRLVSDIRDAFALAGQPGWEVTITIPTSYWYLRGFDLANLQRYVSYFNLMSYDLVYSPRKTLRIFQWVELTSY